MRIRKTFIGIILLITCSVSTSGQSNKADTSFIPDKQIPNSFLRKFYGLYTPEHYIDNLNGFAIYQTETTGDFSTPDRFSFSWMGASFKWNQYEFEEVIINDLFSPGNSLHKLQLNQMGVRIDATHFTLGYYRDDYLQNMAMLQWNHGSLGGRFPGADNIIHETAGHVSPYERLLYPIENRKKTANAVNLYLSLPIQINGKSYQQFLSLNSGRRMFTGFNYNGINKYYPEDYIIASMGGDLPLINRAFFDKNFYLFSLQSRNHMNAEYFMDRDETAKYNALSLTVGGKKQVQNGYYSLGLNLGYKKTEHNTPNFYRNVIDVDGEALEPWYADGNYFETSLSFKSENKLSERLTLKTKLFNGILSGSPLQKESYNPQYYQTSDTKFSSLYVTEWKSDNWSGMLLNNNAGLEYSKSAKLFSYSLYGGLALQGFHTSGSTFIRPEWETNLDIAFTPFKWLKFEIIAGRTAIPFESDVLRFLNANYLTGTTFYWNDANNDQLYQRSEKGSLFTTTGSGWHSLSNNLKQPVMWYFDIPLTFKAGRSRFTISLNYRKFENIWSVAYDGKAEDYGTFSSTETAFGKPIYYLGNGRVNYKVVPFPVEKMRQGIENDSWMYDHPFSLSNTVKYEYESPRTFLSFSFTQYMVVGYAALGNGILQNSVGVLSETSANPNLFINYLGRMDSDRSYILRFFASFNLSKHFSLAAQYKYRDGQSFNDYDFSITSDGTNRQIAIWNNNVKGDNPFTGQTSRREDCFYDFELRGKYNFTLRKRKASVALSVYNLIDLGFQLSEFTFPPKTKDGKRWVLETQIPRGFLLTLEYQF